MDEHADKPEHKLISLTQARALQSVLAQMGSLSPELAANVALNITEMRWHSDADRATAMSPLAVVEKPDARAPKRRRGQQEFCSLPAYFNDKVWHVLSSTSPSSAKMSCLISLATSLGLRLPSEPTF